MVFTHWRHSVSIIHHSFIIIVTFFFLIQSFTLVAQAGVQWHDLGSLQLPGSSNYPASAFWVAGITGTHHHAWLNFVFLVEMGFHHIGQVGLELPTSGDPPTLASQSAGITGVSHRVWPVGAPSTELLLKTVLSLSTRRSLKKFLKHQEPW